MQTNTIMQSLPPATPTGKASRRSASNIPTRDDLLLARCDLAETTLRGNPQKIGVKVNTAAALKTDSDAFRKADTDYALACAALRIELLPRLKLSLADARQYLGDVRHVLSRMFGPKWNPAWTEVGFKDNSLTLQRSPMELLALVERVAAWFSQHLDLERESLGVTMLHGMDVYQRLNQVLSQVGIAESKQRSLSDARKAARKALRKRLSGLIRELGVLLAPDDQIWLAFDLTPPAVTTARRVKARSVTLTARKAQAAASGSGASIALQAA